MATEKKNEQLFRIMSLDGSMLYKNVGFTATKNGKADPAAFRGVMDESLDTLMLAGMPRSLRNGSSTDGLQYAETTRFCSAIPMNFL